MSARVSNINASPPGSRLPLLGSPDGGARSQDIDGVSFASSATAFAEATSPSQQGQDGDNRRASKSPELDTPRASHEHVPNDTAWPRFRFQVLRFWILEILSFVIAVGLLSTIAVVLKNFDGKPLAAPEWYLNININSLIAILATVIRVCIGIVAAGILGQARWLWFQGPRPRALHDLQEFDNGSRGAVGSLGLLGTLLRSGVVPTTAWSLGLLGAVVTVLGLAVGTFTQQAADAVNCRLPMPGQKTSLPVAYQIEEFVGTNYVPDPGLKAAMISGLLSQITSFAPVIPTHCPTGNCSFTRFTDDGHDITHASLGLCSQCIDTTKFAKIQRNMSGDHLSFPGLIGSLQPNLTGDQGSYYGIWMIVGTADVPWSDMDDSQPRMPPDITAVSLVNISIFTLTQAHCQSSGCPHNISLVGWVEGPGQVDMVDMVAASCTLYKYPCLRSYLAEFQSGTLNETLVSTTPARGPDPNSIVTGMFSMHREPCEEPLEKCQYRIDMPSAAEVNRTMGQLLQTERVGAQSACQSYGVTEDAESNLMQSIDCGDRPWLTPLWGNGMATLESISNVMDDLSTAVTNHWRAIGSGPVDAGNGSFVWNRTGAVVYGDVWQATVCLKFDWQWLLLPAGLIATVAIMLVLVLASSYMDQSWQVWKGSLLPLVFYRGVRGGEESSDHDDAGRDGPAGEGADRDQHRDLTDLTRLEAEAKETMVVFRREPSPGFVVAAGT